MSLYNQTSFYEENVVLPDHLLFREVTTIACNEPDLENDLICTDHAILAGDSGAGLVKLDMDNDRAVLIGVQITCCRAPWTFCWCIRLRSLWAKQDEAILLNPKEPSPFLVSKPLTVISDQLQCTLYPDIEYPYDIVNRNISQISEQDWIWLQDNCGLVRQEASSSFKIMGGQKVKAGQMHWTVLLTSSTIRTKVDECGNEIDYTIFDTACTGTLISKQHLITTAHCLFNEVEIGNKTAPYGTPYKAKIMIGNRVPENDSDPRLYRLERARFLSPDFFLNGTCNAFDYAIVEFEPALDEEDLEVAAPACLPVSNPDIVVGTYLTIAGWGSAAENNDTEPDDLAFRRLTTKDCVNPKADENEFFCTDPVGLEGDCGAGFIKQAGSHSVLVGIYQGTRYRRSRCFLWFAWLNRQDYGLILNPEEHIPFPGASKPISVITEKLGCVGN